MLTQQLSSVPVSGDTKTSLELDQARNYVLAMLCLNDQDNIEIGELSGMHRMLQHAEQVMQGLAKKNYS